MRGRIPFRGKAETCTKISSMPSVGSMKPNPRSSFHDDQRAMGAHERSFLAVEYAASRWPEMFRLHVGAVKPARSPFLLARASVCELT